MSCRITLLMSAAEALGLSMISLTRATTDGRVGRLSIERMNLRASPRRPPGDGTEALSGSGVSGLTGGHVLPARHGRAEHAAGGGVDRAHHGVVLEALEHVLQSL